MQGTLSLYTLPFMRTADPPDNDLSCDAWRGPWRAELRIMLIPYPTARSKIPLRRNHGEAAQLYPRAEGPHTVDQSAADILALLSRLKLFPNVLIGHSFGGKVVLSMARQFAERAPVSGGRTRLPRRVDVWVLDTGESCPMTS